MVLFLQESEGVQRFQNNVHFNFFPNYVQGRCASNLIFSPHIRDILHLYFPNLDVCPQTCLQTDWLELELVKLILVTLGLVVVELVF